MSFWFYNCNVLTDHASVNMTMNRKIQIGYFVYMTFELNQRYSFANAFRNRESRWTIFRISDMMADLSIVHIYVHMFTPHRVKCKLLARGSPPR